MVTATNTASQQSVYTYDADGRRVRRHSYGQETRQVYGMEGELLAEYSANSSPTSPQKEYGYRNGQLLVTAAGGADIRWLASDHLGTPRMIADRTGPEEKDKKDRLLGPIIKPPAPWLCTKISSKRAFFVQVRILHKNKGRRR